MDSCFGLVWPHQQGIANRVLIPGAQVPTWTSANAKRLTVQMEKELKNLIKRKYDDKHPAALKMVKINRPSNDWVTMSRTLSCLWTPARKLQSVIISTENWEKTYTENGREPKQTLSYYSVDGNRLAGNIPLEFHASFFDGFGWLDFSYYQWLHLFQFQKIRISGILGCALSKSGISSVYVGSISSRFGSPRCHVGQGTRAHTRLEIVPCGYVSTPDFQQKTEGRWVN